MVEDEPYEEMELVAEDDRVDEMELMSEDEPFDELEVVAEDVMIDEAQHLSPRVLEELRLLSNFETDEAKLLQIVLFGQPELDENLRQPNIRQLRERITHSFGLAPLTVNEVREYLMFRLRAAGYRGPDLFSGKIVNMIARASGGLTRRINLIADKAMLAAFSENTHTLKPRHIEAALRDIGARRYHRLHAFHKLLHGGQCTKGQVQAWALNRYYYQAMIPIKDASLIARCEDSAVRREWRSRLVDHDGERDGDGGIARWLRLTDGLGLDRDYVTSLRGLLPATRFAVEAYVRFVREKTLLEAIASSLTEMFSPQIITDLIGKNIDIAMDSMGAYVSTIQGGQVNIPSPDE